MPALNKETVTGFIKALLLAVYLQLSIGASAIAKPSFELIPFSVAPFGVVALVFVLSCDNLSLTQ